MNFDRPVSHIAYNGDRSLLAVAFGRSNDIEIHQTSKLGSAASLLTKLTQHELPPSSLDWHPMTNLLLTTSPDRNCIVWNQGKEGINLFNSSLVAVNPSRSIHDGRWNQDGSMFALALAVGGLVICKKDSSSDWWVIHKQLSIQSEEEDISEEVLMSVTWSAEGQQIIAGTLNSKLYLVNVDKEDGKKCRVIDKLALDSGWITKVSFNVENKHLLAACCHEDQVKLVKIAQERLELVQSLETSSLLLRPNQVAWANETTLLVSGFGQSIHLFRNGGSSWTYSGNLVLEEDSCNVKKTLSSEFKTTQDKFKAMSIQQTSMGNTNPIDCITSMSIVDKDILSTGAINGSLLTWTIK